MSEEDHKYWNAVDIETDDIIISGNDMAAVGAFAKKTGRRYFLEWVPKPGFTYYLTATE